MSRKKIKLVWQLGIGLSGSQLCNEVNKQDGYNPVHQAAPFIINFSNETCLFSMRERQPRDHNLSQSLLTPTPYNTGVLSTIHLPLWLFFQFLDLGIGKAKKQTTQLMLTMTLLFLIWKRWAKYSSVTCLKLSNVCLGISRAILWLVIVLIIWVLQRDMDGK